MATHRPDADVNLRCKLEPHEVTLKGRQQAEVIAALDQAEAEKKAANSDFSKRIETCRKAASDLANEINSESELRLVRCHWSIEFYKGRRQWCLRRMDTPEMEVVDTSPVTRDDDQEELFIDGIGPKN
jgi:hypothetical protein